MRKLLALLLLLVASPAFAQVDFTDAVNVPNTVDNSSFNNCIADMQAPTCGLWQSAPGPADWTNAFGSTEYAFSYTYGSLYQTIDLSQYKTNAFNFYFDFDLNNSCRNSIGGYCENVDGPVDYISAVVRFYDEHGLNNQFTFLNGNVSTASIQCDFELLGICLGGYSAYSNWQHFGWYSSVQSDTLFTSAQIEFTGYDVGFWGGLYGPRVDNPTLQINYIPPPYPVVGGSSGMNVAAPGSDYIFIYKGNDPLLFSQLALKGDSLLGWSAVAADGTSMQITSIERPDADYLFLHTNGAPINGTWYSFQQQAPTVDCVAHPSDTSCIIAATSTGTTDTTVADTSTTIPSTSGTIDVSPTQSTTTEIVANTGSTSVESFAAQEKTSDPVVTSVAVAADPVAAVVAATNPVASSPANEATYRELTAEEKAAILADAISKNVIEGALTTISSTSAASASNGSQDGSSSGTSTVRSVTSADNSVDTSTGMFAENQQSTQTETQDTSFGLDMLETGRVKGQEALAATMAATENSANESMSQAESIASTSSTASFTGNTDDTVIAAGVVVNNTGDVQSAAEASAAESVAQAEAIALASIESSKPNQSAFDDGTNADADLVNTMIDPGLAMATAMNNIPNVANLEILGVLGNNKPEEKSDAEKRAAEVVAANQQQMEEINKNYMEADQSGIVAAMGADTDVGTYRTAMIADAAQWYKDKDIYKGVIIKDNVRGSYFLEKGSTDTYKKMVEEQYK